MKLIVGLGNPGEKYDKTRHNVGFRVVEELIQNSEFRIQNEISIFQFNKRFGAEVVRLDGVVLAKPATFMNESGRAVRAIADFYQLKSENIYVVHDDLDIKLGEYKIQLGKGPRLHYGVESVEKHLKTDQFWRVRVGVENRQVVGNRGIPGMEYVLQKMSMKDRQKLAEVVKQVVGDLEKRVIDGNLE